MGTEILPVRPGTLSRTDKKMLREAGVVVVEHENPEEVKLISLDFSMNGGDLFHAAITAIYKADDYATRKQFIAQIQSLSQEAFDSRRMTSRQPLQSDGVRE